MLTRLLAVVALLAVAASAHAATLNVVLPGDAALHVVEAFPPPTGPRIACPPTCSYSSGGGSIGILDLRVTQDVDPRTNDEPFDILAMNGCAGTSALPATNGTCRVPDEGNATISFTTRYRPILAVTVGGSLAGELANLFIVGGPGPGYQGNGAGFSCNAVAPENPTPEEQEARVRTCANHLSAMQPVYVQAPDNPPISEFVSASAPCSPSPVVPGSAQRCDFPLEADTCVSVLYLHSRPPPFPERSISGPNCPEGPGVDGTGSGGGNAPPDLTGIKQLALAAMRTEFERVVYPCLVGSTGVSLYASLLPLGPAFSIMIGGSLTAAAAPLCAAGIHRLVQLQLIHNDPPDPNFQEVARIPKRSAVSLALPDCSAFSGSEKRFCRKLGKRLQRYVGKDGRVGDVAETLRITVERASGAFLAGDDKALKKQLRAARKRERQLSGAMARRARSGAKLAKLFDKQEISVGLDGDEFAAAVAVALGHLADAGLAEDEATALLDAALDPRPLDLLEVLGTD